MTKWTTVGAEDYMEVKECVVCKSPFIQKQGRGRGNQIRCWDCHAYNKSICLRCGSSITTAQNMVMKKSCENCSLAKARNRKVWTECRKCGVRFKRRSRWNKCCNDCGGRTGVSYTAVSGRPYKWRNE